MKIKRLIAIALAVCCVYTAPAAMAEATAAVPDIDIDFSAFSPGDSLSGITTQYVPDRGTISYEVPPGYDRTFLCFDDTYSSTSGPKMQYPFNKKESMATVHGRLLVGNTFRFDLVSTYSASSFSDGIRISTNASGAVSVDNTNTDAGVYAELPVKVAKGEEFDVYMFFDFYGGYAHVALTSPTIAEYFGALPKGCEKIDGYVVVKEIPLTISDIGRVMYLPTNGTGKSYIEFVKVYDGNQLPVQVTVEDKTTNFFKSFSVQPFKSSWINRPDTIMAYLNGYLASESQRFGDNRIIPEAVEPDITPYLPTWEQIQPNLTQYAGVHPRVLFTQDEYKTFREKLQSPEFERFRTKFEGWCETRMNTEVGLRTTVSSVEQQYRVIGTELTYCTWAYQVTGDKKYADKAIEWMEFAFVANDNNPNKPATHTGGWIGTTNCNLAAGQYVRGLADVYDRCYDLLSDTQKENVISHLVDHAGYLCSRIDNKENWGKNQYLGNFGMCQTSGMLTAALAIYDEKPDIARHWIESGTWWFANMYAYSGTDGASIEGINYWSFGFPYICSEILMSQRFFGYDPVENVPWIKNSLHWRLYISLPKNSWTKEMNTMIQGDSTTSDVATMEAYFYAFADRYDMPEMQWLAEELQLRTGRNVHYAAASYNPEVTAMSPEELNLPTLRHFEDRDMISARSDWSGDESMVYFGCGSLISKTGQKYLFSNEFPNLGEAHSHPDANHFQLFANGDFLLRDDGYVYKQTNSHNTLLVSGMGQKLEGGQYIQPSSFEPYYEYPYIKKVVSEEEYDYFVGCGANAYPLASGLERFNRHMLYLKKDDVLVVIDDIKTQTVSDLELRFFPQHETVSELDGVFVAQGPKNTMYMENLTPDQGELSIIDAPVYYKQSSTDMRNAKAFAVKSRSDKMLTATAISWSGADQTPKRVSLTQNGKNFVFTVGSKTYTVNTDNFFAAYKEAEQPAQNTFTTYGESAEPALSGVIINNIPLAFEAGVQEYTFNLDDYYKTADDTLTIKAIPGNKGINADITITAPEAYPGQAVVTAELGGKKVSYTINLQKTAYAVEGLEYKSSSASINDKLTTFFLPKPNKNEAIFTLTQKSTLCGVEIAWQNTAGKQWDYRLLASADGKTYSEIYAGKSSLRPTTMEYIPFDKPVSAAYIKLVVDGEESDSWYAGVVNFMPYKAK